MLKRLVDEQRNAPRENEAEPRHRHPLVKQGPVEIEGDGPHEADGRVAEDHQRKDHKIILETSNCTQGEKPNISRLFKLLTVEI